MYTAGQWWRWLDRRFIAAAAVRFRFLRPGLLQAAQGPGRPAAALSGDAAADGRVLRSVRPEEPLRAQVPRDRNGAHGEGHGGARRSRRSALRCPDLC